MKYRLGFQIDVLLATYSKTHGKYGQFRGNWRLTGIRGVSGFGLSCCLLIWWFGKSWKLVGDYIGPTEGSIPPVFANNDYQGIHSSIYWVAGKEFKLSYHNGYI